MSGVNLQGVHLLLTYKCLYECDHCFVWSSPSSQGTMTLPQMEDIIRQAHEIPSVKSVSFEGGEPFLFYPLLRRGIELARNLSLDVEIVSNAYFATDDKAAELWLRPFADLGSSSLTLSTDVHHGTGEAKDMVLRAKEVGERLGMSVGVIEIEGVEVLSCPGPRDESKGQLLFRGRAADKLAGKVPKKPWRTFDKCPEEPPNIGRVHVDPYGNVMFCQGISVGNVMERSLKEIVSGLDPEKHPVIGPLIRGGPIALAREHGVRPRKGYADACNMCYETRRELRRRGQLKNYLEPDQVYGVTPEGDSSQ
jgi:MoaA/NifB/PqqE/SkfB family radical SAM enzyme